MIPHTGTALLVVPMTDSLAAALAAMRHLCGARVLVQDDRLGADREGPPGLDEERSAARRAQLLDRRHTTPAPVGRVEAGLEALKG